MYKSYRDLGVNPEQNVDLYSVTEISSLEHKEQILKQNRVVCIDIYTNWCQPCKQIEPSYAVLCKRYNKPGTCILVKENLEKDLTNNIRGVPTFHIFNDRKLVDVVVGANLEDVEKKLKQQLEMGSTTLPTIPKYAHIRYNE